MSAHRSGTWFSLLPPELRDLIGTLYSIANRELSEQLKTEFHLAQSACSDAFWSCSCTSEEHACLHEVAMNARFNLLKNELYRRDRAGKVYDLLN